MNIAWRYINLDWRLDRLVLIRAEMEKAGIAGERVSASLPTDPAGEIWELNYMRSVRPGAVGCYLSHRRLLESWRGRAEILGVLEDDCLFCEDFQERLAYIDQHLAWPWDIFFLGSCYHCNPPYWHKDDLGMDFRQTKVKHLHRLYGAFGTHAYLVNPSSIPKILTLMDRDLPQTYAYDHLLILLGLELDWYGFTPGMVFQRDGYSDIIHAKHDFGAFRKTCGPYVFANQLADFDYDAYNWAEGKRP